MNGPDPNARFVRLDWYGPFHILEKLQQTPRLEFAHGQSSWEILTDEKLEILLSQAGVYAVVGDHVTHGDNSLLYIGQGSPLNRRIYEHFGWIQWHTNVQVYFAVFDAPLVPEDPKALDDIEHMLIHAHSPIYNSQNVRALKVSRHTRLWNLGRSWRLLPEISSEHPSYDAGLMPSDETSE